LAFDFSDPLLLPEDLSTDVLFLIFSLGVDKSKREEKFEELVSCKRVDKVFNFFFVFHLHFD